VAATDLIGEQLAEFEGPLPHGFMADDDATRGQQLNRAEDSHQPTRRREQQMKQFKSAGQAQLFLSAHDQINNSSTSAAITSSTELPRPKHFRSGRNLSHGLVMNSHAHCHRLHPANLT
jgi:hypothetical protein